MEDHRILGLVTEVISQLDDCRKRFNVIQSALNRGLTEYCKDLNPRGQGPTFMSLPPEIRNMIYRCILVQPHDGYLRCDYLRSSRMVYIFVCRVDLCLFRVNRQVNSESSNLFYGENTFAIADQQRYNKLNDLRLAGQMCVINVCHVKKMHVTNRESTWLSNPGRTSMGVYRDSAKKHVWQVGLALKEKPHQMQYLLLDCFSGFGMSARMALNLLQPLYGITGIKNVHLVGTDKDHFPCLRYLENEMMSKGPSFLGGIIGIHSPEWHFEDVKDKTEQANVGNEIARILKINPCYPPSGSSKGR